MQSVHAARGSSLAFPLLINPPTPINSRVRQFRLLKKLCREAGIGHFLWLSLLSTTGSLVDVAGLGLAVNLLLGSRAEVDPPLLVINLPLPTKLGLLIAIVLLSSQLQALVTISRERLRTTFTDRLRQKLFQQVFSASSSKLYQLGRGDLLSLLMADIARTAQSLDQAVRLLQACVALGVYTVGVLLVSRQAGWPLILALLSTVAAALLQRSGSWQLGKIQSRLNSSLQRTLGDGVHGLKAIRAAAAESWMLDRFAKETAEGRWLLQEQVRRRSSFNAWRNTLVVGVVGLWMLSQGEALKAEVLATTLLLAYRAGASLSAVVQAQRLCLGNLPGYEALWHRRQQLQPHSLSPRGSSLSDSAIIMLKQKNWSLLEWKTGWQSNSAERSLELQSGCLIAITGPSGSGKTTLLDRVCGLLAEEHSQWVVECDKKRFQLSGAAGASQLHQLIAYAPQNAVLFEASLRDNLLLGQEESEGLIETWLHRLDLGYLLKREGGLDTPMHLAQDPFSGGEIHRLGLLRAWLRNLPVDVLDEPTAFLDANTAKKVRCVIEERVNERLVLVSTHDPELIKQADHVILL